MSSSVADAEPLLSAFDLVVGHHADLLRDVRIELRRGESWFVVGRNGGGKTTLVHTLLGLVPRRGGRIELAAGVRAAIGYVPQESRFEPALPLQVKEFVSCGIGDGIARRDVDERVAEALHSLGIEGLARHDVRALSAGQRRRVAVARAVVRRPVLLVLDEPLANLDRDAALALANDLDRRRQGGTCIVHVAHELEVARRFATHVAIVDAGLARTGAAPAIFGDPAFRRLSGEVVA